ncbi:trypsin-like serine protease [Pseudoalteromonas denitrificans]|uniref:Pre-peptidase C-terminal domain-containing protein n=1 Tax=Pseudoalteromonas denitrificans DSM 6059 TaxID=1123010 RepID=A0A1I1P863_9GAMM|nr:trypsin-like serine protease [Pseudoalteromonas denitrificans]SFD05915.1 pre-peptidase C-terminal domain-containing protein [Pseudoalteromonas denitrificans DSM 6059]
MKKINKNLITIALTSLLISPILSHASDLKMNIKTSPTIRIVGGEIVKEGVRPWMTSLQFDGQHFCGASLISESWVLTAAHCVEDITKNNLNSLSVRSNFISLKSTSGSKASVADVYIHPDYNQQGKNASDIALVKLSTPITNVSFIKLATDHIISASGKPNAMASVSGWGALQQGGNSPDILQKVNVPIVSNQVCNAKEAYDGKISSTEICAGLVKGGKDSCQGDSGGPLVITHEGKFVQAGVVSWGEGCAQANKYGVYARVNSFNAWIDNIKKGNGTGLGGGNGGGNGGEEPQQPEDGTLISGQLVTGLSAQAENELIFKIDVGPDAKLLWLDIAGGEGDADIYLKHEQAPTQEDYDYAPIKWGNDEHILIRKPESGTWYIKIVGYEAFEDLELMGFAR